MVMRTGSFACDGTSDVGGGSEEATADSDTASDLHSWRTRLLLS